VHPIRDQQQCGSCWAFAASEAFSDRACIASKGAVNIIFSPENLVQCENDNMGCNGGYLDRVWKYLERSGIVSDDCQKYTSGSGKTESCKSSCDNPDVEYKLIKCQSGSVVEAVNS
jgi:cathepsin B